jgi:endonuclease/exonuclease/phosphatase family metal-dependent hydrolase
MTVIGTWNLENLFRPGGNFGPPDEATYRAKLRTLADMVIAAGPDLLGVQEVGEPEALADLVDLLPGTWFTALSTVFEDSHPIRVGVLSRLPIDVLSDTAQFPAGLIPVQTGDGPVTTTDRAGRGVLAVRVDPPGAQPLTLVVCHLKSKLLSYPGIGGKARFFPHDESERARYAGFALHQRAAEAVTVRDVAEKLLAGHGHTRRIVVVGDLNDELQSATTQILHGPPGSEIGTRGFDRPDTGDARRLWNLAPMIPAADRYSRVYQGRPELIDHILVSRALVDKVDIVRAVHGLSLPSVGDDPVERRAATASDHAPVLLTTRDA